MKKRYSYQAYPDQGQQKQLARLFGGVRVVFNDYIAQRRLLHRHGMSKEVPARHTAQLVTRVAKQNLGREFLSDVSAVPLQHAVKDAQAGYQNFFDSHSGKRKGPKMGMPKFKKRTGRQKARFTRNARFSVEHQPGAKWGWVILPKIGAVKVRFSRDLPVAPSSVTIIGEPDGSYHVSFVVEANPKPAPAPVHDAAGIDVGIESLAAAVHDDGKTEKIGNPRHLKAQERKLAKAQRSVSRKKKGSKNKAKARRKVARIHAKVRNTRSDHHHKLSRRLVDENQVIAFETLGIKGLLRMRLAKQISDAAWGHLIRLTEAKATEAGREVIRIPRNYPSTQTCSACGCRDGKKDLGTRNWQCPCCHTWLDRDLNAAVNIMIAAGLAQGHTTACASKDGTTLVSGRSQTPEGGSVRPERNALAEPMKQEPTEQTPAYAGAA